MKRLILLPVFIASALNAVPKDTVINNARLQEIQTSFVDLNNNLQEIASDFNAIINGSSGWGSLVCCFALAGIEEELQRLLIELDNVPGHFRLRSKMKVKIKKALLQTHTMNQKMNL